MIHKILPYHFAQYLFFFVSQLYQLHNSFIAHNICLFKNSLNILLLSPPIYLTSYTLQFLIGAAHPCTVVRQVSLITGQTILTVQHECITSSIRIKSLLLTPHHHIHVIVGSR